jgi:KipI family sensor histidine kinase inhibitor
VSPAPRPAGPLAWLVDAGEPADARGLHAVLAQSPLRGQVAVRPGARTVLVSFDSRAAAAAAQPVLAGLAVPAGLDRPCGAHVVVDVVYDGADLEDVAAAAGMSSEALVAAHSAASWTAAFVGFAPGFAYLEGWALRVARWASPRTRVPAGAVAVADGWSAVYPSPSPGGWQLLGTTTADLWRTDREPPALIAPGDGVRFRPTRPVAVAAARAGAERDGGPTAGPRGGAEPVPAPTAPTAAHSAGSWPGGYLLVRHPGPLTLVEDDGRPGVEHLGVPPSGAADRTSARTANRVVGNRPGTALLETLGDLELACEGRQVLAVHGSPGVSEVVTADGAAWRPLDGEPFLLEPGDVLHVAPPIVGARRYVAVRGGIDLPPVLGSRSSDLLSSLGPAPLRAGVALRVGRELGVVGTPAPPASAPHGHRRVRVTLGPRDDWFTEAAVAAFLGTTWHVAGEANRVGLRLDGPSLERATPGELASEPMVPGAVQVPPVGRPVVLLRDHPTTGGYPVLAVVWPTDLDVLGQAAPGDPVRFVAD